jgi:hypothetical protein
MKNRMGGAYATVREGERCVQCFGKKNLREIEHWRDTGVDGRIILRRNFKKWGVVMWTGLSWLRIETGGWHL